MSHVPIDARQRDRITGYQLARLRALVAEIVPSNRFWTARLEAAGLRAADLNSLDALRRLPPVTKAELGEDQARHAPFGTNVTFPIDDYVRVHTTSGTTAEPLVWPDTAASWQWMLDNWKEIFRAAGLARGDVVFFAFSFGPFLGFWTAFESAAQLGARCLSGGGMSSRRRLHAMARARATVLCCTPTYALHLVETAREMGLAASELRLRTVIVAGEPGGSIPAVRKLIRDGLGGEVFDHHGMTETGPVTYQCPARPGVLRVLEQAYLAEILDPATGEPTAPGGEGELVLTTLGRSAAPLIRYRTGDLVRPVFVNDDGSGDGVHLALDGGVLARGDDMVIVRGVNVYPSAVEDIVRSLPEVAEYRVEVSKRRALTELMLEVEARDGADGEALCTALGDRFADSLSLRIPVRLAAPGTLPRFEMKARRWVRASDGEASV